jgi:carbon catabolite-derepressing protein kinase
MGCIYRALTKLGAEWELEEPKDNHHGGEGRDGGDDHHGDESSGNESGHERGEHRSARHSTAGPPSHDSFGRPQHSSRRSSRSSIGDDHGRRGSSRQRSRNKIPYLPEDPWIISCRWLKGGMYPPGMVLPGSTHSSTANLTAAELARRRSSTIGSVGSAAGSPPSLTGIAEPAGSTSNSKPTGPNDSVYIYMEIQLYQMEKDLHLVDFKCAGYERLFAVDVGDEDTAGSRPDSGAARHDSTSSPVHDLTTSAGNQAALDHINKVKQNLTNGGLRGAGRQTEEKEVSSPFPFLDFTSKLIVALAEAN